MINPTPNSAIVPQEEPKPQLDNALVVAQSTDFALMKQKVNVLIESGFLPKSIDTWQKGVAIIMQGRELNVPDFVALKHISVIHGTPSIDGQLTLALIQRSGLLEQYAVVKSDPYTCTLTVKRRGHPSFTLTCERSEAGEMQTTEYVNGQKSTIPLTEKANWKQQPKTMLFYFTIRQVGRRMFADVLNGMVAPTALQGDLTIPETVENAEFYDEPGQPYEIGQTPDENPTSVSPELPPEPIHEGELVEPNRPADTFDDEFPPIGVVPKDVEPEVTIGSLSMDSLWRRSRIPVRSEFNRVIRDLKAAGKIKENVTADQVVDAIKAWQAAQEFTEGKVGAVEE